MASPPPPAAERYALGRCRICGEGMRAKDSVELGPKALDNIRQKSKDKYADDLWKELGGLTALRLHKACRQKYIKSSTRVSPLVRAVEDPRPALRSQVADFDPKLHCLLCGGKGSRARAVHRVETSSSFEKAIRRECARRGQDDTWGAAVQSRISQTILDFPAAEVRYHQDCSLNFRKGRSAPPGGQAKGRRKENQDCKKVVHFNNLCNYIDGRDECQYTMTELYEKMTELAGDAAVTAREVYSKKHMSRLFKEHYGCSVFISGGSGDHNIVNFTGFANKLLQENWYKNRNAQEGEEKLRVVKLAANILLEDMRKTVCDTTTYPTVQEMVSSPLPPTLTCLLEKIVTTKSEDQEKVKKKRIFLGQALMFASRPKSYLPPALLALSTDLHRRFGSRELTDEMKAAGFGVGYKEVRRFVFNLTEAASNETPATENDAEPPHVQYVWDNVDWNKHDVTGRGSIHVLGGLRIVTPAPAVPPERVPRQKMPASVVQNLTYSEYGVKIPMYQKPERNGLDLIKVKPLDVTSLSEVARLATNLDVLWLAGRCLGVERGPSWNGFNAEATRNGEIGPVSGVIALPFVNDNPSKYSTLNSALLFASADSKKYGRDFFFVTMDLPLYAKSVEIVTSDTSGALSGVIVRLGGFHLLMSFLGAIGHIMDGSGLEDLWGQVYGPNTVKMMMSGKDYARANRAHSLAQEAVGALLLDTVPMEGDTKAKIKEIHEAIRKNPNVDPASVAADDVVRALRTSLERAGEEAAEKSNTGRLWWQYFKLVGLLRLYVRAERVGDWELHLECIRAMLPYFHAAGRIHYAKYAHLYVQQMDALQVRAAAEGRAGLFTVRRKPQHWAGVWTDMVIEQNLMRLIKSRGGLTGRGFTESAVLLWILSAPAVLEVSAAVQELTGVYRASSGQHVELRDSFVERDTRHLTKFTEWLREHSPFVAMEHPLKVQCISTGKLGSDEVNCYRAQEVGVGLMKEMYGKDFGHVGAKRKGIVIPLSHSAPVNKKQLSAEEVNTNLLFMRMCRVGVTPEKLKEFFQYELTSKPAALFDDKGLMRHNDKSALARRLREDDCLEDLDITAADLPGTSPSSSSEGGSSGGGSSGGGSSGGGSSGAGSSGGGLEEHVVVDGGHLLHSVKWPKAEELGEAVKYRHVCKKYVDYCSDTLAPPTPLSRLTVVFDGYEVRWSTKDEEQKRRADSRQDCADVNVGDEKEVTYDREKFLSNKKNKSALIRLLRGHLHAAGITVKQADADADVPLAEEALLKGEDHATCSVRVVAKDTDIVAILVARGTNQSHITVTTPGTGASRGYNVGAIRQHLGEERADCLLAAHAFTGCDTTSAIHRKGKVKLWDLLKKHRELRDVARVFNHPNANVEEIVQCGEKLFLSLYARSGDNNQPPIPSLDLMRYYEYNYKITHAASPMSVVLLADLPPTSDGARQHSLRVYLTVQDWLGNSLDPTEWGWYRGDRSLHPVPSKLPPAPQELLHLIACNCKTGCRAGSGCSCRKADLPCTPACGKCRGERCSNTVGGDEADWDNF
ncbi:hypothetical protein FOCC_FOCC011876 [Frankliniella occidentalis]|nr:hypothetical protein FOCC_FOCC011876 [Frankliniella occidentalis]